MQLSLHLKVCTVFDAIIFYEIQLCTCTMQECFLPPPPPDLQRSCAVCLPLKQ